MIQEITEAYRLSPQQERLWSILDGTNTWLVQAALSITGALDRARLRRCLEEIVQRHEILRTRIAVLPETGLPAQFITSGRGRPELKEADLRRLQADDLWQSVRRRMIDQRQNGFDYSTGDVFKTELLCVGNDEHVLMSSVFAMCADRATMGNIIRDVVRLYAGAPVESEIIQYVDYTHWQNELVESPEGDEGLTYWGKQQASKPLKFWFEKQNLAAYSPAVKQWQVGQDLVNGISQMAERQAASARQILEALRVV